MASTSPSLTELAASITKNAALIENYLKAKDLSSPSFNVDSSSESPVPAEDQELEKARIALIDATAHLHDLALGPRDYLMGFLHNETLSLHAIYRFGLANTFGPHEEVTFGEVAERSGVSEADVRRLPRHAMARRVFCEPRKGIVAHTAASRLLAEDQHMAAWIGASMEDLWPSSAQTVNAMLKWPASQEPNETGFALANGSTKSAYQILADHPDRAIRFGNAMKAFTEGSGYDLKFIGKGWPWASIGEGTVVDVGGSSGFVCIQLASEFPSLRFVVQDLQPSLEGAEKAVPPELKDRIQFMPHDFIKSQQPVKNADVYFFRWIFHNWSDKYCKIILRNLIPALKTGARVIIMDNVLPEPGTLPNLIERRLRAMDLTMLELQNSKEREMDDWRALFEDTDPSFEFRGGSKPEGSNLWILEATWKA